LQRRPSSETPKDGKEAVDVDQQRQDERDVVPEQRLEERPAQDVKWQHDPEPDSPKPYRCRAPEAQAVRPERHDHQGDSCQHFCVRAHGANLAVDRREHPGRGEMMFEKRFETVLLSNNRTAGSQE
jgi:hypothetical protein